MPTEVGFHAMHSVCLSAKDSHRPTLPYLPHRRNQGCPNGEWRRRLCVSSRTILSAMSLLGHGFIAAQLHARC